MDADALRKIRCVADYQFGKGVGAKLFPDTVNIIYSKNTGKIRYIHTNRTLLATLRPTTGLLALTIAGAQQMARTVNPLPYWVKVHDDAEPFVAKGRSAFAKYVTDADPEIRPQDEVIVINSKNEVVAVGRALLSAAEMKAFRRGTAVCIRRGIVEKS